MPKVIDLPTATTMDSGDYFVMEESSGGTKKITKGNSVLKVENQVSGIVTRTSGSTIQSSYIRVWGKVALLFLELSADQDYGTGTNVFVGSINSAYRPVQNCIGAGYYGGSGMYCQVQTDGSITVRMIGASLFVGSRFAVSVMLMLP